MMKSFSCSPLIFLVFRETVAQPQPNVWVMAFCLGKLTDFPKNAERFPEIVESNGPLDAVGRRPLAIDSSLVRPEARLPRLPD